jgi:ABC-type transport system substrate-binding protein
MAIRKRYYFWLFKAYIKRWRKTIATSVILGIIISIAGIAFLNFYIKPSIDNKIVKVGMFGIYSTETLPPRVLQDVSYGLTNIRETGEIVPAAATRWEIKNEGKEYTFYLKKGQIFHNGEELTAHNLPLTFRDAQKKVIDDYTVSYTLSAPYAPFLTTVAKPIVLQDFSGLGVYKLQKIDLNAGFIKSLTLQSKNDSAHKKIITFYPTQAGLKTAYMLGEVDLLNGATTLSIDDKDLQTWTQTSIEPDINYSELVTLFYNNTDANLSDKKLRQALNYALPEKFAQGERAYSPIPPQSMYHSQIPTYAISDIEIAKEVLSTSSIELEKPLEITTTPELESTAKQIASEWKKLGIETKITVSETVPRSFQVLLYRYKIPADPDQYTLWHSDQINNIGKYKNLRIDNLLEKGRVETDPQERVTIYADFQKYLLDDVPASFLYFPIEYTVKRT